MDLLHGFRLLILLCLSWTMWILDFGRPLAKVASFDFFFEYEVDGDETPGLFGSLASTSVMYIV